MQSKNITSLAEMHNLAHNRVHASAQAPKSPSIEIKLHQIAHTHVAVP